MRGCGQDLTEIWDYIAADNLEAADLADKSLRFDSVHSYLIVYRWETQPLQIVRVLHGARDVRAILDESR